MVTPAAFLKGMESFIGPDEGGLLSTAMWRLGNQGPILHNGFQGKEGGEGSFPRDVLWRLG